MRSLRWMYDKFSKREVDECKGESAFGSFGYIECSLVKAVVRFKY